MILVYLKHFKKIYTKNVTHIYVFKDKLHMKPVERLLVLQVTGQRRSVIYHPKTKNFTSSHR